MKPFFTHSLLALGCLGCSLMQAQTTDEDFFVYGKDGTLDAFPDSLVQSHEENEGQLLVVLKSDSVIRYDLNLVESFGHTPPADLPKFTSFKFNNKYNDQVFTDVVATFPDDDHVTAQVAGIGKRLTPSFQLDNAEARAYVHGAEQTSKVSRLRFDGDVVYTLAPKGFRMLRHTKVQDELWSEGGVVVEKEQVPITADMLSTNAPSNYPETEGLDKMLDGNPSTFFHSTWGSGEYEKLPSYENPFIECNLPEALSKICIAYTTRENANRLPSAISIQVSSDGVNWTEAASFTQEDGMPGTASTSWTSPVINLGGSYDRLRFVQTATTYKNYLCLAEFSIWKVTDVVEQEPEMLQPAVYEYAWEPYGRQVTVSVDWLTDHASQVPRIDLNVEGGQMISSKEVYLNAEIIIDGAGIWPDLKDSVLVKGRGNTSWQGTWGKSPYRLKFATKQKPFGLTKGKSWVLLANNQSGSMMTNAVAMKVANLIGAAGANHIIPVELYINGEYRGSYNFTEHIGFSNNSIDIEDESNATLLELDSYYDEAYKFRDNNYNLPVNIKEPDFEKAYDEERLNAIQTDFNALTQCIQDAQPNYAHKLDVDKFAKYMFVNVYVHNRELYHPKSCYVYREDLRALHSPYVFGPVWDFDWAYGYDGNYTYCREQATQDYFSSIVGNIGGTFFNDAYNHNDAVQRTTYRLWTDFMERCQDEVIEYVDDYYRFAQPSFEHNATIWSDGNNYATYAEDMKNWLQEHADYVYANLKSYDLEQPETIKLGDANLDGHLTTEDGIAIMRHLAGITEDPISATQADADGNGVITLSDAVTVSAWAIIASPSATQSKKWDANDNLWEEEDEVCETVPGRQQTPSRQLLNDALTTNGVEGSIQEIEPGKEWTLNLKLTHPTMDNLTAFLMRLTLPAEDTLRADRMVLDESLASHQAFMGNPENDEVGLVVFSTANAALQNLDGESITIHLVSDTELPEGDRTLHISQVRVADRMGVEQALHGATLVLHSSYTPPIVDGITSPTDTSDPDVYTMTGVRLGKRSALPHLPKGIYIIGGQCRIR